MNAPRPSRGFVCLLVLLLAVNVGCLSDTNSPAATVLEESASFHDAADETGLLFRHDNGMTGVRYMPEMLGAGSALFDYDRDGDLDVFLVQGCRLEPDPLPGNIDRPCHPLYRNDLQIGSDGKWHPHLTDVSTAAGLTYCDYGMGVAAGDYDNDGWIDLYVTCLGANRLLRNTGHSGFQDVTAQAGLADEPGWSSSAAWSITIATVASIWSCVVTCCGTMPCITTVLLLEDRSNIVVRTHLNRLVRGCSVTLATDDLKMSLVHQESPALLGLLLASYVPMSMRTDGRTSLSPTMACAITCG